MYLLQVDEQFLLQEFEKAEEASFWAGIALEAGAQMTKIWIRVRAQMHLVETATK